MAMTLSPALIEKYGGVLAAQYSQEISDLEASLDIEWPTWNHENAKRRAFAHLPYPVWGRIALLVKRRRLILQGLGDYGCRLVYRTDGMPFAIMVKPRRSEAAASEAAQAHHRAHINITAIVADLGIPLERVESAIPSWRGVAPIREHVAAFEKARKSKRKGKAKVSP